MVEIEIKSNKKEGENLFEDEVDFLKDATEKLGKKIKSLSRVRFEVKKYNREGRQKFAINAHATIGDKAVNSKADDWKIDLAAKKVLEKLKREYDKKFKTQSK